MRVMITGITGTIGKAFCELLYNQHTVVGIDRHEERVAKYKRDFPNIEIYAGDFANLSFVRHGIDVLIHLAAMKHIDLCEVNVNECVTNNIIKTHNLFRSAYENSVDIIFMSTDKAVEPCSVYGYTKALGEHMATEYGGVVVRSGNVLASTGSVLNIWDEQIKSLKPIKLTHKNMQRYFISPENLVSQIWTNYLDGKRLIIPKMDRNVKLKTLLKEKLSEHGYTIKNYPPGIEYTGLRLGEKIRERLEWSYE